MYFYYFTLLMNLGWEQWVIHQVGTSVFRKYFLYSNWWESTVYFNYFLRFTGLHNFQLYHCLYFLLKQRENNLESWSSILSASWFSKHLASFHPLLYQVDPELQIRGSFEDNSKIIVCISKKKHIFWPIIRTVSSETFWSRQFWWWVTKCVFMDMYNYPYIIPATPSYLEHRDN